MSTLACSGGLDTVPSSQVIPTSKSKANGGNGVEAVTGILPASARSCLERQEVNSGNNGRIRRDVQARRFGRWRTRRKLVCSRVVSHSSLLRSIRVHVVDLRVLSQFDTKASWVPSGDQEGLLSGTGSLHVNRRSTAILRPIIPADALGEAARSTHIRASHGDATLGRNLDAAHLAQGERRGQPPFDSRSETNGLSLNSLVPVSMHWSRRRTRSH